MKKSINKTENGLNLNQRVVTIYLLLRGRKLLFQCQHALYGDKFDLHDLHLQDSKRFY